MAVWMGLLTHGLLFSSSPGEPAQADWGVNKKGEGTYVSLFSIPGLTETMIQTDHV